MSKLLLRLAGLGLVASIYAMPASAQDRSITTSAGKRVLIAAFGLYDHETCYPGAIPEGRVAKAPENGRVEFDVVRQAMQSPSCRGIPMNYRAVYYTPKAGFRGTETVSIDFFYDQFQEGHATSRRQTIQITVK